MALRNILKDGDKTLNKTSRQVTDYNKRLHILLDDMLETLIEAQGVGLAAPQVGVLRRAVIVLDTSKATEETDGEYVEFINPVVIEVSGEQTGHEGCLSVPGIYGIVTRADYVKVRANDRNGNFFEYEGHDLTARAILHELDHLDGILFTSKVSRYLTEEELEELRNSN